MTDLKDFHDNLDRMNAAQSKVNMQNDIDNFSMDFAEFCSRWDFLEGKGWYFGSYEIEMEHFRTTKELLQKFKEQNGK